jgi:hypothetical protein
MRGPSGLGSVRLTECRRGLTELVLSSQHVGHVFGLRGAGVFSCDKNLDRLGANQVHVLP